MSRREALSAAGLAVFAGGFAQVAPGPGADPLSPLTALGDAGTAPEVFAASSNRLQPGMEALYFAGLPFRGRATRVFAIKGTPLGSTGVLPAVVLVHGGGGTAYAEWVERWMGQGFVAISIAVEGQTDVRVTGGKAPWQPHDWAGPSRKGIYADTIGPEASALGDQWMYHAVGATILARNLLRADPRVDPERVGLSGISWGGVIAATTMGVAPGFSFAVPIYGCGRLGTMENQYQPLARNPAYQRIWEPALRLNRYLNPSLWLTGANDTHFSLGAQAQTIDNVGGPTSVTIRPGLGHSHPLGWGAPESYAFARAVVGAGPPWPKALSAETGPGVVQALFETADRPERIDLLHTADTGFTGGRTWTSTPAAVVQRGGQWQAQASLPEATAAWFLNATFAAGIVSAGYWERGQ
jgi:dienelactone hydrolase